MHTYLGNGITFDDQLNKIGKELFGINKWYGVIPSDMFKNFQKHRSKYAVMNTDSSKELGTHWLAIAKLERNKFVVYDSFGRQLSRIITVKGWNPEGAKILVPDNDPEQKDHQEDCGQRCLAFLYLFDKYGIDCAMKL